MLLKPNGNTPSFSALCWEAFQYCLGVFSPSGEVQRRMQVAKGGEITFTTRIGKKKHWNETRTRNGYPWTQTRGGYLPMPFFQTKEAIMFWGNLYGYDLFMKNLYKLASESGRSNSPPLLHHLFQQWWKHRCCDYRSFNMEISLPNEPCAIQDVPGADTTWCCSHYNA